jgi:uncharacterized protein YgiM (DUF1202 family)
MQTINKILFPFFLLSSLLYSYNANSQTDTKVLIKTADSLFIEKKYSEAYKIYSTLFTKEHTYTPQSLLKMAFIKEAWGDNIEAVYYLNYFYEKYPEKKVFNKMKDVAEKKKLVGYNYSDFEFFSNLYRNYDNEVILGIMGVLFIYFLSIVGYKIVIKRLSNSSPYFFIIFLFFMFYLINFGETYINPGKAIVMKDKSLLMDNPSAGAKVIGTIAKGTRIMILEETDIWLKIKLNDKDAYIRKVNIII